MITGLLSVITALYFNQKIIGIIAIRWQKMHFWHCGTSEQSYWSCRKFLISIDLHWALGCMAPGSMPPYLRWFWIAPTSELHATPRPIARIEQGRALSRSTYGLPKRRNAFLYVAILLVRTRLFFTYFEHSWNFYFKVTQLQKYLHKIDRELNCACI